MSKSGGRSGLHAGGCDRDGYISYIPAGSKSATKLYASLKGHTMSLFATPKDTDAEMVIQMENCDVRPPESARSKKKLMFDGGGQSYTFMCESSEEHQQWMSALMLAAVPSVWPSGICFTGNEQETMIVRKLPRLKEVPVYMRRPLLLRKLLLCSVTFDFARIGLHTEEKDLKRQTLLELVDYCDTVKGAFNDASIFVDVMTMIGCNLFRALPYKPELPGEEDEEEEPFMEPSWPHLSIVYEFLLHLVQSQQIDLAHKKKGIDAKFVRRLLPLFQSEDLRERDYLKTITHRIYGKLTHRRAAIRRAIANVFYQFVYEGGKANGVAELLEILASIINGFATPIKEEHKKMLTRALIPLHKTRGIASYHPQLIYCMTLYASKEPELLRPVFQGLLRFWPYGNSPKEMLLLNEVEELFDYMEEEVMRDLVRPLFSRLAKCIESDHFQVAERALWLWNNQPLVNLAVDHDFREQVLPLIFKGLYENSSSHWHESVKQLSQHVLALYMEADAPLYERCLAEYNAKHGGGQAQ